MVPSLDLLVGGSTCSGSGDSVFLSSLHWACSINSNILRFSTAVSASGKGQDLETICSFITRFSDVCLSSALSGDNGASFPTQKLCHLWSPPYMLSVAPSPEVVIITMFAKVICNCNDYILNVITTSLCSSKIYQCERSCACFTCNSQQLLTN